MAHTHDFHPVSGWCATCPVRDDGRVVVRGTEKYPGPTYTPEQLAAFLTKGQTA